MIYNRKKIISQMDVDVDVDELGDEESGASLRHRRVSPESSYSVPPDRSMKVSRSIERQESLERRWSWILVLIVFSFASVPLLLRYVITAWNSSDESDVMYSVRANPVFSYPSSIPWDSFVSNRSYSCVILNEMECRAWNSSDKYSDVNDLFSVLDQVSAAHGEGLSVFAVTNGFKLSPCACVIRNDTSRRRFLSPRASNCSSFSWDANITMNIFGDTSFRVRTPNKCVIDFLSWPGCVPLHLSVEGVESARWAAILHLLYFSRN
ncbi:MAG TPA: hypothetical protein VJ044_16775 [Candidatus Hodarchaeales archaeon]|nr:hypothetical protein [Candidatus Hodarchaeales archaeon]